MDRLELTVGVPAACHQAWSGTFLELPSVLVLQMLTAVELSRSVSGSHPVWKHPLKSPVVRLPLKLTVFSSLGDYFGYGPVGIGSCGVPPARHQTWSGILLGLPSILVLQISAAIEPSRSVSGGHPLRKHSLRITSCMVASKIDRFLVIWRRFWVGSGWN
jgi:hypothetical protein